MNKRHLDMLSSPRWTRMLEQDLLPWLERVGELGEDVLEIGPGPRLTTDLLRERTARLTAVEVDPSLAAKLAQRLADTNVTIINRNAARTGLDADRFSTVASFAMLHHVPDAVTQNEIFAEMFRVLRPGGLLVGSDGYDNESTREAHVDDLFVPIDPADLPCRLTAVGFTDVTIQPADYDFRFHARKPVTDDTNRRPVFSRQ